MARWAQREQQLEGLVRGLLCPLPEHGVDWGLCHGHPPSSGQQGQSPCQPQEATLGLDTATTVHLRKGLRDNITWDVSPLRDASHPAAYL